MRGSKLVAERSTRNTLQSSGGGLMMVWFQENVAVRVEKEILGRIAKYKKSLKATSN